MKEIKYKVTDWRVSNKDGNECNVHIKEGVVEEEKEVFPKEVKEDKEKNANLLWKKLWIEFIRERNEIRNVA